MQSQFGIPSTTNLLMEWKNIRNSLELYITDLGICMFMDNLKLHKCPCMNQSVVFDQTFPYRIMNSHIDFSLVDEFHSNSSVDTGCRWEHFLCPKSSHIIILELQLLEKQAIFNTLPTVFRSICVVITTLTNSTS